MEPTREIGWNIGLSATGMYILDALVALFVLAVIGFLLWKRLPLWKIGKPEKRTDHIGKRLAHMLTQTLLQKGLLKQKYPGITHSVLFWGFVILFIGTTIIFIQEWFTIPIFRWDFFHGSFYLGYSFILDLFGGLAILAVLVFALRRYVQKPSRLDRKPVDAYVLVLVFLVLVTGFLVEGSRIAIDTQTKIFEKWSFIGWELAKILPGNPLLHRSLWWLHLALSVGLLVYVVPSSLIHIITASANLFLAKIDAKTKGAMRLIPQAEFESAESFGAGKLEDLTWKQIFDSDACTRCGRCQDACPAWLTTKPLSPKKIVQDLKNHWLAVAPTLVAAGNNGNGKNPPSPEERPLIGTVFQAEEIWACTNCRACIEACPVGIDQVDIINDVRRNLVMVSGEFPNELQTTLRNMETQGNPWGLGAHRKAEWAKDLNVPLMAENPTAEYLFYVGCAAAFNPRNQTVARAFVKILQHAGIDFAILGEEEQCCGDTARRAGNEYLFQMMAEANITTLKQYQFKKILLTCPHGYHTFTKEYPQLGANFEVIHHADFIHSLIRDGKLILATSPLSGKFTYHDSCFMGRYNDIYAAPRAVLKQTGIEIAEMKRSGRNGLCCGAGGARMWLEEEKHQRVNSARVAEALATGAEHIALSCPYCMTMIEDGLKEVETKTDALDIAEVVAAALRSDQA